MGKKKNEAPDSGVLIIPSVTHRASGGKKTEAPDCPKNLVMMPAGTRGLEGIWAGTGGSARPGAHDGERLEDKKYVWGLAGDIILSSRR